MEQSRTAGQNHQGLLRDIAARAMTERGLLPDFAPAAKAELGRMQALAYSATDGKIADLRDLLWASIDNDDSRDLDQLTVAQALQGGVTKVLVAVADVDALVKKGSAIDEHALYNTTSVYTAGTIFPMLPERLSTDLSSLGLDEDRLAIVIEMHIDSDGTLQKSDVYRAWVRNHAKLAYNSVAAWLEGKVAAPEQVAAVQGLEDNLRLQDKVAQLIRNLRHIHGALSLQTIEARPVFDGGTIRNLEAEKKNRATNLIEDFMIAANGVTARYLATKKIPSIRRVVRTPKRWGRIIELAEEHGFKLPDEADAKALDEFLVKERGADPLRFPDLSLSVIKLLGAGEYVAEIPGTPVSGHFGLAVKDYAHSTAPNRRYPDLVTHRLLKAAFEGQATPYSNDELNSMAKHFTSQEEAANKVERQVGKSAAALLLESKIGQHFDAIVTGASDKGTWVRLLTIPVEGRVVQNPDGLDVGERTRVQLLSISVERGYIDFKNLGSQRNQ